jgi:hypothetical protein
MSNPITVTIPVELTAAMIIRGGVVTDEALALSLAEELHDVVAKYVKLRLADKRRLVEYPKGRDGEDDPEAGPIELEPSRGPNALEIADFTLAAWRQAMTGFQVTTGRQVSPDGEEGRWISEELAALSLGDDSLWLRWCSVCDSVTGSELATMYTEGAAQ